MYSVYNDANSQDLAACWFWNFNRLLSRGCLLSCHVLIGLFWLKTFWPVKVRKAGANHEIDGGRVPFSWFSFRLLLLCTLAHYHKWISGTLEWNGAIVNVVSNSCAFSFFLLSRDKMSAVTNGVGHWVDFIDCVIRTSRWVDIEWPMF